MKFYIEYLEPDESEVAYLRKADLGRADLSDLTLKMLWSKVGLTHEEFTFDGYGFAIGYIASILYVVENLSRLGKIEIVLDESADWLHFEHVNERIKISGDEQEVLADSATFVRVFREFALGFINDTVKRYPDLGKNSAIVSLLRRIRRVSP